MYSSSDGELSASLATSRKTYVRPLASGLIALGLILCSCGLIGEITRQDPQQGVDEDLADVDTAAGANLTLADAKSCDPWCPSMPGSWAQKCSWPQCIGCCKCPGRCAPLAPRNRKSSAPVCPMFKYDGCRMCPEAAFCHHAQNKGCGGNADGGVSTFQNVKTGHGCAHSPLLTIPRSHFMDIDDLSSQCSRAGAAELLAAMLAQGYDSYGSTTATQCIHKPNHVSVRWLHLHTFCQGGHVDNLPNMATGLCAIMTSPDNATNIANKWLRNY